MAIEKQRKTAYGVDALYNDLTITIKKDKVVIDVKAYKDQQAFIDGKMPLDATTAIYYDIDLDNAILNKIKSMVGAIEDKLLTSKEFEGGKKV